MPTPTTHRATRLAVQLYTLRDYTKTPADIAKTCKRLADDGWKAVQASALGPIEPTELKKILDDNGLVCCATHRGSELWENPQKVIDDHAILDCQYTAIGGFFPGQDQWNARAWHDWIARYNQAAQAYKDSPLRIGYHNHSHEFAKLGGQQDIASPRPWDLLLSELDDVWFEVDTYWVAHAGAEPSAWITRLAGRVPCIHMKDMGITQDRKQYMAEVGVGNLDWPAILKACRHAEVAWYIVEQDTCYRDPFESLKTSLDCLNAMGLS